MSKLLLVFTGGTISMKTDPEAGVAVLALTGREILALVPGLDRLAEYEVIDFARLAGPQMTPERMFALSELVNERLRGPDLDGAVITHGTDTLEEAAYLVDLRHLSPKPIVFVGAMRNSSELGWDGPANLYAAIRVALDPYASGQGVLVVLNDTVHAASEATKTDTQALDAFQSPTFGPLALVEKNRVFWRRSLPVRQCIPATAIAPDVELLKVTAGCGGRLLDFLITQGVSGVVIEGTGRGNVPPAMLPAIQRAIDAGIPLAIASRCLAGHVLDTYGYEGSGRDLRRRGAMFAGALPGQKARIKLLVTLGHTTDPAEVRGLMEHGLYA